MVVFKNSKKVAWLILLCCIILLPSCNKEKIPQDMTFLLPEGSECIEIINADSLSWNTPYIFRPFYDGHPAIIANNYLTVIDDTLSSPIPLSFDHIISDIHWIERGCFFSADSTIFYGGDDGKMHPLVVSNRKIDSFCVSDNRILFPVDSSIVEYIFESNEVTPIVQVHSTIHHLVQETSSIFFSAGNDLFLYYSNELYHLFYSNSEIITFAIHPSGSIFLGSEKGLSFLTPEYKKIDIASIPIRDLTLIGDDLFVIFKDNSSVMLTNVSQFNNLF